MELRKYDDVIISYNNWCDNFIFTQQMKEANHMIFQMHRVIIR